MEIFNLYKDIQARTNGEIYIGVVGPVRTGKSTFIKRFMDLMVLPNVKNEYEFGRAKDELPQSAGGVGRLQRRSRSSFRRKRRIFIWRMTQERRQRSD